jgi:hypothetical protein
MLMKLISVIFATLLLQSSLWATESKLLAAMPADCNIVVGVEIAQIFEIPMIKGMLAAYTPKANEFDPRVIKSMAIGLQAEDEAAFAAFATEPNMIMVIQTTKALTRREIFRMVNPKDAKLERKNYLGKDYFAGVAEKGQIVCLYQINPRFFIIATQDLLEKSIMLQAGKTSSVAKNKLMAKLLKSDGNLIYAGGFMKKSEQYKGFSLGATYKKGIVLRTKLFCKAAETAATHAAQINVMVPMLTANPELGLKASYFKISAKKSTLYANVFLPEAALMKIPALVMPMVMQQAVPGKAEPEIDLELPPDEEPLPEPIPDEPVNVEPVTEAELLE